MNKFYAFNQDTSFMPNYIEGFKNASNFNWELLASENLSSIELIKKSKPESEKPIFSESDILDTYANVDNVSIMISKKCKSCKNHISIESDVDLCNCCDLNNGAPLIDFPERTCMKCHNKFTPHDPKGTHCLNCSPNLQSLKTNCFHCSKEFIRKSEGQIFCSTSCEKKSKQPYRLMCGICCTCGSYFLATNEKTACCSNCSPSGGELLYVRPITCSVCNKEEVTSRSKVDLCDCCYNISTLPSVFSQTLYDTVKTPPINK